MGKPIVHTVTKILQKDDCLHGYFWYALLLILDNFQTAEEITFNEGSVPAAFMR